MDARGQFAATFIDSSSRALAAGAANRLLATGGNTASFDQLRASAEDRLLTLAESLATGVPEVFLSHCTWLKDACVARGLDGEALQREITAILQELEETLPADTRSMLREHVLPGLEVLKQPVRSVESPLERDGPHVDLARRFLLAVLESRRDDALALLEAAVEKGVGISALELDVIGCAQAELGIMWARGELQIAEEHLATGIVQESLALLRRHIPAAPEDARRVVVAAVGGNAHELGARIVSDHFLLGGWSVTFLGANTPSADVVWALEAFRADVVALSVAITTQLRICARLVEAIRQGAPDKPILVGGGPFLQVEGLWRAVGADAGARDVRQVVEIAGNLLSAQEAS